MRYISKILTAIAVMIIGFGATASAQQDTLSQKRQELVFDENTPMMNANETPRLYHIRKVNLHGVTQMSENNLRSIAGLIPGDTIYLPSNFITNSISRLWAMNYFSDVKIGAVMEGDSVDMEIYLKERPRVYSWNFVGEGIGNPKKKDLAEKLKLKRNTELSDYIIDKNEKLLKKEFADKGFRNTEVKTIITNDSTMDNVVHVTFHIDRKDKVRVGEITFDGNETFTDRRLRRTFKKTHQVSANFFRTTKFNPKEFENDKELLIDFYNSQGYRNATINDAKVYDISDNRIGVHLDVDEGKKFYIRDVKWVGNSVYETEFLQKLFGVKKGDAYDRKSMHKRLGVGKEDDASDNSSVKSLYQNNGYLASQIDPSEVVIGEDSIDLEVRIFEGKQYKINEIGFSGNTRVNDEAIRRELAVYPGQLYNRALLMYSLRQLMSMQHFDPEQLQPDIKPVSEDKVDISFPLVEQASDQFNIAGGWGAGSFVGSVGITLNNVSTRGFFDKTKWTPYPMGQNQKFSVSGQTNGTYYKAIAASFTDPWVGGHKPNSLSVSAHWSEQNNAYYIWQTSTMHFRTLGLGLGLGKRLNWPDPNFTLYAEAQYRRYALKNWDYFIMKNGVANELSVKFSFGRSTIDQPIYSTRGSEFSFTTTFTPPYSLWDGVDYADKNLSDAQRY
ncbi:MAG: outer membrane protein assembly factor BamA, partial [Alistipes sp.]|nr:outer membrane protein assembly factor BamA [Alistipes sp.]